MSTRVVLRERYYLYERNGIDLALPVPSRSNPPRLRPDIKTCTQLKVLLSLESSCCARAARTRQAR
eukprot:scaffold510373_cov43-Prasinocladus_malaysianus.AAC.1